MKINSLDTENTSNATIYKLSQTYIFPNSDPILQKGFYTENFLKSILKESFEFALKCFIKRILREKSYRFLNLKTRAKSRIQSKKTGILLRGRFFSTLLSKFS